MSAFTSVQINKIIGAICGASGMKSDAINISRTHGVSGVVVNLEFHIIPKNRFQICYVWKLSTSHNCGKTEGARNTISSWQGVHHTIAKFDAISNHKSILTKKCSRVTVQFPIEKGTSIVGLDCALSLPIIVVNECIVIYDILQFGCLRCVCVNLMTRIRSIMSI